MGSEQSFVARQTLHWRVEPYPRGMRGHANASITTQNRRICAAVVSHPAILPAD